MDTYLLIFIAVVIFIGTVENIFARRRMVAEQAKDREAAASRAKADLDAMEARQAVSLEQVRRQLIETTKQEAGTQSALLRAVVEQQAGVVTSSIAAGLAGMTPTISDAQAKLTRQFDALSEQVKVAVVQLGDMVARGESMVARVGSMVGAERAEMLAGLHKVSSVLAAVEALAGGSTLMRVELELQRLAAHQLTPGHVPAPEAVARVEARLADVLATSQRAVDGLALVRQEPAQVERVAGAVAGVQVQVEQLANVVAGLDAAVKQVTAMLATETALDLEARCRTLASDAVSYSEQIGRQVEKRNGKKPGWQDKRDAAREYVRQQAAAWNLTLTDAQRLAVDRQIEAALGAREAETLPAP